MLLFSWISQAVLAVVIGSLSQTLPIQIETVSGDKINGVWAGNSDSAIRFQKGTTISDIAFEKIVSIEPASMPDTKTSPTIQVSLVGGTQVFVQDLKLERTKLMIEPRRQKQIAIPLQQVQSVRFRLGAVATDPQWLGFLEKPSRRDVMVIRRAGQQLDPVEGLVVGLNLDTLEFDLEGETIEAPIEKLEGVVFRSSGQPQPGQAVLKILDVYGTTWAVRGLKASEANNAVRLDLADEVIHELPLEQIQSMRWSSGRVLLASATPAETEVNLYVPTKLSSELTSAWFSPRADGDDLLAVAGSHVEYRIDPGFRTLAGSVARDKSVHGVGSVSVRILVDDDVKWQQSITDDKALGFRVSVDGGRRTRLEVLADDDGDVGDQVRFTKPRLLK